MTAQFINKNELAVAFGVHRTRVAEWDKAGCPRVNTKPAGKTPMYRYNVAEVAAWLREREQAAAPDAAAGEEVEQ